MNDRALVQELRNAVEETALVDLLLHKRDQVPDPKRLSPQKRVEVERTLLQYELINPDIDLCPAWYSMPKGRRVAERLVASRTSGPGGLAAVEKALMRFIQARRPDWMKQ